MRRESIVYKILASLALLLLTLSSCIKEDRAGEAISFYPVAAKPTKAIIDGSTYPADESFVISAYYNASAATPGSAAYFEDCTAAKDGTYWETSSAEYWPLAGRLDFYAYSPASAGLTLSADGVSASSYTITTAAQMSTDLCYASASVTDCSAHPDAVPLVFSHALAQVVFRVKAADYYSSIGNTVSLAMTSLSLSGICSVGNFSAGSWSSLSGEHSYTLSSSSTALTYDGSNNPETTLVGAYLLLPQTLGANAALNVGYSITQSTLGTLSNPPAAISLRGGSITEWLPGRKYVYTLSIGMEKIITFTASTTDWADDGSGLVVE